MRVHCICLLTAKGLTEINKWNKNYWFLLIFNTYTSWLRPLVGSSFFFNKISPSKRTSKQCPSHPWRHIAGAAECTPPFRTKFELCLRCLRQHIAIMLHMHRQMCFSFLNKIQTMPSQAVLLMHCQMCLLFLNETD